MRDRYGKITQKSPERAKIAASKAGCHQFFFECGQGQEDPSSELLMRYHWLLAFYFLSLMVHFEKPTRSFIAVSFAKSLLKWADGRALLGLCPCRSETSMNFSIKYYSILHTCFGDLKDSRMLRFGIVANIVDTMRTRRFYSLMVNSEIPEYVFIHSDEKNDF